MTRDDALNRNILLYRLHLIFGANGLMTTVIYFFFTLIKGLSPAQALSIVGLSIFAKALSEVPTGVVADKFSRKFSILTGYTVLLIGWLGICITSGFLPILLFSVCLGIGGSFISGADDALLYDSLKELGESDKFKAVYNLSSSIELVAFASTILLGGLLGGVNLYWPVLVNLMFITLSVVITFFLVEPSISRKGENIEQTGYLLHTKSSFKTIFSKTGIGNGLLGSFLSLALTLAVFKSTKNILSPILSQYSFTIPSIGLIVSVIILIKAIGGFLASKTSKPGDEIKEAFVGLGICIIGLLLIAFVQIPLLQLSASVITIGFDNIITTNLNTFINNKIESRQRSTILSLHSLFARTTEMIFLVGFGLVIDLYSINMVFLFTIGWLVLASLILFTFNKARISPTFHLIKQ